MPDAADLVLQPGAVVGADRVVMGDGRPAVDDGVHGLGLRVGPPPQGVVALRRGHGEVQRGAGLVDVRDVAEHDRGLAERLTQRGRRRRRTCAAGSTSTPRSPASRPARPTSSIESRRYGASKRPDEPRPTRRLSFGHASELGQHRADRGPAGGDRGRCPLEPDDHQAAARAVRAPDGAGIGEVERGLVLVGEAQHGGQQLRLCERPHRRGSVVERGPAPTLVAPGLRQRAHAHGHRRDHPEGTFGAQEHLAEVRPGGTRGRMAERDRSVRRRDDETRAPARRNGRIRPTTGRSNASPRSRRWSRTRRTAGSGRASARARPAAPRPLARGARARASRSSRPGRPRAAASSAPGPG